MTRRHLLGTAMNWAALSVGAIVLTAGCGGSNSGGSGGQLSPEEQKKQDDAMRASEAELNKQRAGGK